MGVAARLQPVQGLKRQGETPKATSAIMSALFWAFEDHRAKPGLDQLCARRMNERRVISGILHVLKIGCC